MTHESNNPCEQLVGKISHMSVLNVWGIQKAYAIGESLSKQFLLTLGYASEPEQLVRKKCLGSSTFRYRVCGVVGSLHDVRCFINMDFFP